MKYSPTSPKNIVYGKQRKYLTIFTSQCPKRVGLGNQLEHKYVLI